MRLDPTTMFAVSVRLPEPTPAELRPAPLNIFDAAGAFVTTLTPTRFKERTAPTALCIHKYERCYACRFNLASAPGRPPTARPARGVEPTPTPAPMKIPSIVTAYTLSSELVAAT